MLGTRWTVGVSVLAMAGCWPGGVLGQPCEPTWNGPIGRPGIDGVVHALATDDDGGRPVLYAGGAFAGAGGVRVGNIARWDGLDWTVLDDRVEPGLNGPALALAVHDDGSGASLYAGGAFARAGGVNASSIARWDGERWFALGAGVSGTVHALAAFDDGSGPVLVAGGAFHAAGGAPANSIAAWDGMAWRSLGDGVDGFVYAMAVFDDGSGPALYVGGDFALASGAPASRFARWDGQRWSGASGGVAGASPWVYSMLVHDDGSGPALFVGGRFTSAGGAPAAGIARWDGAQWSAVGGGIDGTVRALAVADVGDGRGGGGGPMLHAAGQFDRAGGVDASNVARWDGLGWSAVGEDGLLDGTNGPVHAIASFEGWRGTTLVAGGDFTLAGPTSSRSIARWGCQTLPCAADCDGDGLVLVFDYLCFQNLFDAGDRRADLDGDGELTIFDFLAFQNDFDSGCR
jgi:hypothetical protein